MTSSETGWRCERQQVATSLAEAGERIDWCTCERGGLPSLTKEHEVWGLKGWLGAVAYSSGWRPKKDEVEAGAPFMAGGDI